MHILRGLSNPLKSKTIVSSFHKHSFSCAVPEGLPSDLQEDPDSPFPGLRPHLHSPLRSAGRARRGSFSFSFFPIRAARNRNFAWHCFLCSQIGNASGASRKHPVQAFLLLHYWTQHGLVQGARSSGKWIWEKQGLTHWLAERNDGAPAGKWSESSSPSHVSHPSLHNACRIPFSFPLLPLLHSSSLARPISTFRINLRLVFPCFNSLVFLFHSSSSLSFLCQITMCKFHEHFILLLFIFLSCSFDK